MATFPTQMSRPPSLQGLDAILQRWQDYPGSAPNGTGLTGLTSNDANGWSRIQNENTWAMNQIRAANGQEPLNVRYGGTISSPSPSFGTTLPSIQVPSVQGLQQAASTTNAADPFSVERPDWYGSSTQQAANQLIRGKRR